MAVGIIIHITVGTEKRTEFFSQERIRIGSGEAADLQIYTPDSNGDGMRQDPHGQLPPAPANRISGAFFPMSSKEYHFSKNVKGKN